MLIDDDRKFALQNLALLSQMIPSRVSCQDYEPVRSDAYDLVGDVMLIASKVDAVFLQYGLYLRNMGLVSDADVADHFASPCQDAISGNLTFCIERGIESRIEERVE